MSAAILPLHRPPPLSLDDLQAIGRAEVRNHLRTVATQDPARPALGVTLVRAADIRPEPIGWLWSGWLARGKVHLVAGAPGTGKTTLSLTLAAALTTAGDWPDGTVAPLGSVALWSGEDTAADVLVPRLVAAGADPTRVHLISGYRSEQGPRPFDPSRDIDALSVRLASLEPPPALLIVDPLVAMVSGDSHRNAEVRLALQPLVDLAQSRGIAVLGVSHFSKGTQGRDTVERVNGSIGFGALARVVLATAKTEDGTCILVRAKSNLGPDGDGFSYRLVPVELAEHPGIVATRVLWGEVLEGSARDLLGEVEQGERTTSEASDVEGFIRGCLAAGPVSAQQMQKDTNEAGYSWDRVKRVAARMGIQRRKEGFKEGWVWALRREQSAEECEGSTLGRVHSSHSSDGSGPNQDTADLGEARAHLRETVRRHRRETEELLLKCGWSAERIAAELGPLVLPGG